MPRRLAITGEHTAQVISYEDPPLEAHQVLVQTELASGKHGTMSGMLDGRTFRGQRFDEEMRLFVEADPGAARPRPTLDKPWTTGTDGMGTIIEVGDQVTRWKPGDRVFGRMDVRETNICDEDKLWLLGDLDPELALCRDPAYVAIHCVREANVRYGDTVAVIGLGAIGLLAVSMARQAGAETVFGVDLLANRRQLALDCGADHVLDPRADDVPLRIHELTDKAGVDVAIEVTGAYPALYTAIQSARMCGTVCSAGFYQGESHGLWLGREWHHNRLNIVVPHGCGWGHPPRDYPRWDAQRASDAIVSMMRKGRLAAPGLIQPIVSLDEGPSVWSMIENEPQKVVKYAVRF